MRQSKLNAAIWLASLTEASDPVLLHDHRVGAVLALDHLAPTPWGARVYAHTPFTDDPAADCTMVAAAVIALEALVSAHARVLVCCLMGGSRSPALVALHHAVTHGAEFGQAAAIEAPQSCGRPLYRALEAINLAKLRAIVLGAHA